jgi:hypothetical protein
MITADAIAVRAVLKKAGCPDIQLELHRSSSFDFTLIENGKASAFWRTYSPQQLIAGNSPPMSLEEAWQSCMSRYPDYVVVNMDEAS